MKRFFFSLFITILFFGGCANMQIHKGGSKGFNLKKSDTIAIIPFINYTQTPFAGYAVASVADVILVNHGYKTKAIKLKPDGDDLYDENGFDQKELIDEAKKGAARYILLGKVTEYRYKSGIEAKPLVGLVVEIRKCDDDKIVYFASGSQSGGAEGSLAALTQAILDKILP